eukprot:192407-Prymnesium_polylepis.1
MAQPAVARLLYRSLLRTCKRGSRPETFDWASLTAGAATALPHDPAEMCARLRTHFEAPTADAPDPFAVLRHASLMSRVLWPAADEVPVTLPVFVLPSHTLLVGERAQFMLFEPRYRRLAHIALGASHDGDPTRADRRFIHAPCTKPDALARGADVAVGTLVSIVEHEQLDDGRFMIECIAGPR